MTIQTYEYVSFTESTTAYIANAGQPRRSCTPSEKYFQTTFLRRLSCPSDIAPVIEESRFGADQRFLSVHPVYHALDLGIFGLWALEMVEERF